MENGHTSNAEDVEVTDEMIEAGAKVLRDEDAAYYLNESPKEIYSIAEAVFLAMWKARPSKS